MADTRTEAVRSDASQGELMASIFWRPRRLDHTRHDMMLGTDNGKPASLFWSQPPWHHWPPEVTTATMRVLDGLGIWYAALRSELGTPTVAEDSSDQEPVSSMGSHRILPYRNERYGLSADDFDGAKWVDLRLSPRRARSGRYAYDADLVARWEGTPDESPLSGGGWIPAKSFPPDLESMDGLSTKVQQLKSLSGGNVVVSLDAFVPNQIVKSVLDSAADAISLHFGDASIPGGVMAERIMECLERCRQHSEVALWIEPAVDDSTKTLTAHDAAKLIAMGVSGIAIDSWMVDVVDALDAIPPRSQYSHESEGHFDSIVGTILAEGFKPRCEHFIGLCDAIDLETPRSSLGSSDPKLAERLGIEWMGQATQPRRASSR
ncbi:MAG: hypothetical protein AAF670_06975 [Planctomycetota bacterium]